VASAMASAGLRTGRVGLDRVGFEIAGMGILVSAVPRRIAQCTHSVAPRTHHFLFSSHRKNQFARARAIVL
jgi:hypothetical protein